MSVIEAKESKSGTSTNGSAHQCIGVTVRAAQHQKPSAYTDVKHYNSSPAPERKEKIAQGTLRQLQTQP